MKLLSITSVFAVLAISALAYGQGVSRQRLLCAKNAANTIQIEVFQVDEAHVGVVERHGGRLFHASTHSFDDWNQGELELAESNESYQRALVRNTNGSWEIQRWDECASGSTPMYSCSGR